VQGPGTIQDRTEEHLGTTDKAIIANRRALIKAIQAVQAGQEPPHVIRDATKKQVTGLRVISEIVPSSIEWQQYSREEKSFAV